MALVDSFPEFYKQTLLIVVIILFPIPKYHLAFNPIFYGTVKHILIDNKPAYLSSFTDKNVNFINNLLDCLGSFKSWNVLKTEFKLADSLYFSWKQLINAIPLNLKTIIQHNSSSANLLVLIHHLMKKNNLISLDKCTLENFIIY